MLSPIRFLCIASLATATLVGCASQPITVARTHALKNRQNRMDDRAAGRADQQAIRSDAADARSQLLFYSM